MTPHSNLIFREQCCIAIYSHVNSCRKSPGQNKFWEGRWCWIVQVLVLRSGLKFWLCFVLSVKSCLSKSSVFRVWGHLCDYQDLFVCKETHLCSSSPTVGLLVRCVDTSSKPSKHSTGTGFCFLYSRASWCKPSLEVRLLFLYRQKHWAKIGTSLHPSVDRYLGELHFSVIVNISNENGWAISLW